MKHIIPIFLLSLLLDASCRKEETVQKSEETVPKSEVPVADPESSFSRLYVLNEGNINENRCTLDFLDMTTGIYTQNIYPSVNPTAVKELGDVGNDVGIYGSKMYAVINMSNKVEVMEAYTGKRLGQIDLKNGRFICFANGKAYVSAYNRSIPGTLNGDDEATAGIVVEIDTSSLQITRTVSVGRQPDGVGIANGKLYVANSGGYSPLHYEHTVSVVDLNSFQEIKRIDVAVNLDRIQVDAYGDVYVNSMGDYNSIRSKLFAIDSRTDKVKDSFDIAVNNFYIHNDTAYVIGTPWNNNTGTVQSIHYLKIDTHQEKLLEDSFIKDGSEKQITMPYGIFINPDNNDIYLSDAKDYQSAGTVYCVSAQGQKKWQVQAGQIPAHFALLKK